MEQKITSLLLCVLLPVSIFCSTLAADTARAEQVVNLLPNSSFENANPSVMTQPDSWFTDSWGNNSATFSHIGTAHTGTKAIQTTITNYQDGDAKWLAQSVKVDGGDTYHYTNWYMATTTTHLWAQYTDVNGKYQYAYLRQLAVSTMTWAQTAVDVTIPTTAQRINLFHVIAGNGTLTIDDVSLSKVIACPYNIVNGLSNGNFEDTCYPNSSHAPLGWQAVQYGASTATFNKYSNITHSGLYAAQITNSNGEAGYSTSIAQPLSNQRYTVSFWQNSTTYSYAYLAFHSQVGETQYQSLMSTPATQGEWSLYEDTFLTPANVASIQLVIATSGTGILNIDDVSLTTRSNQVPSTFNTGMISLTFDDGLNSEFVNGFNLLKQYGYSGTFYINSGTLNTPGYMTTAQVKALVKSGQEVGSHLYDHTDMVQLDPVSLENSLQKNVTSLQAILGPSYQINTVAGPYGSFTSSKVTQVMQNALSHRNTDGALNTKANLNVRQIHARLVKSNTSTAEIKAWTTEALTNHSWLVLVYHSIATTTPVQSSDMAEYTVTPLNFKKQLDTIRASGIAVENVSNAIEILSGQ